jgi:hypothetical protein
MESLKSVLNLVQKGGYAISIDLSDAYMHIPIYYPHRKYLSFSSQGKAYRFRAQVCTSNFHQAGYSNSSLCKTTVGVSSSSLFGRLAGAKCSQNTDCSKSIEIAGPSHAARL